jgi:hypothetical protein
MEMEGAARLQRSRRIEMNSEATRREFLSITATAAAGLAFASRTQAGADGAEINVALASEGATIAADSVEGNHLADHAIDGRWPGAEADDPALAPEWIWSEHTRDGQVLWLVRAFDLAERPERAALTVTCDDRFVAWLNGREVATGELWIRPTRSTTVAAVLRSGRNVLAIRAENGIGPAGLCAELVMERAGRPAARVATDSAWHVFDEQPGGWPEPTERGLPASIPEGPRRGNWGIGLPAGRWYAATYKSHPHWLWVRFRVPARISRVVLHRGGPALYPSGPVGDFVADSTPLHPVDFVLETSSDGGRSFVTVCEVRNHRMPPGERASEFALEPVVCDNLRLRIERSSDEQLLYHAALAELEVFGRFVPPPSEEPTQLRSPAPRLRPATPSVDVLITERNGCFVLESPWLHARFAHDGPRIIDLRVDSLGQSHFHGNLLKADAIDGGVTLEAPSLFPEAAPAELHSVVRDGNVIRYELALGDGTPALVEVALGAREIRICCSVADGGPTVAMPHGLRLAFDLRETCVAPLAEPRAPQRAPVPLLLHAADRGSLRVECPGSPAAHLSEQQRRAEARWDAIIHAAQPESRTWEIRLSVPICPVPGLADGDPLAQYLPRHWLNGLQYHPDTGMLGNNMFNESCSMALFSYAEPVLFTPPLPGGVDAMAMVRESVDGYLTGAPGYARVPDLFVERWLDAAPSVLIAAWCAIRALGDEDLLGRWLPALERLGSKIEAQDRDGTGLPQSPRSGNRGEHNDAHQRNSSWWDVLNAGHEDAYCCALAYRGLTRLVDLERLAGRGERAAHFAGVARRLREAYVPALLNPETGVLAGWRSRDGQRHDYWFPFVNGMAICYGLVDPPLAHQILDRFQAKFREVGFHRFDLGLPCNLVPIARDDYIRVGPGLGGGDLPDGSDGFQHFQNGAATACFAYFYVQALYEMGRYEEGAAILGPLMRGYAEGMFQDGQGGRGEWRRWDGTPSGLEGYLADSYHAQMALFTGHFGLRVGPHGFSLADWSTSQRTTRQTGPALDGPHRGTRRVTRRDGTRLDDESADSELDFIQIIVRFLHSQSLVGRLRDLVVFSHVEPQAAYIGTLGSHRGDRPQ